MAFFRVEDTFAFHQKAVAAGNAAIGLWVRAGSWSAANRTNGLIPGPVARQLGTRRQIARLAREGFWLPRGDDFLMVNIGVRPLWDLVAGDYRPNIPDALRQAVYERDGYACLHCGAAEPLSLDHIWPWSLGGTDTFENLQTLCRPCNSRKGARV